MKKLVIMLVCSVLATSGFSAEGSKKSDLKPSKKTADYCASFFGSDTPEIEKCSILYEKCEKNPTKECKEFLKQYRKHLCEAYDC